MGAAAAGGVAAGAAGAATAGGVTVAGAGAAAWVGAGALGGGGVAVAGGFDADAGAEDFVAQAAASKRTTSDAQTSDFMMGLR